MRLRPDPVGHGPILAFMVRNHLSSAIGKTGTRNRAEALRTARDGGWL